MKIKTKLILCGLMVAFATFWTIKPLRNAVIAPGYGACGKCVMPWKFTNQHFTSYGSPVNTDFDPNVSVEGDMILFAQVQYGMFVLCERCWTKLTPAERLPYYRESYDKWHTGSRNWEDIKSAVLAGG